jgi:hypothetical protein
MPNNKTTTPKKKSLRKNLDANAKEPFSMRLENGILAHLDEEADELNVKNTATLIDTMFKSYFATPKKDRILFLTKAYSYNGKREK